MAPSSRVFPEFDQLPTVEGQPQGCLWGFFDQDGKKDELGSELLCTLSYRSKLSRPRSTVLNLLTPEIVKEASKEIQTGMHVQLDWSMHQPHHPAFGRLPIQHKVKDMSSEGFVGLDDEIHINTQTSSQWDSLKHFSIQKNALFYNGLTLKEALETPRNGIHNICGRGGIVGRGVMVDWLRWWEHQNPGQKVPSATSSYTISVSEIQEVLRYQNTFCRQGDILIVRTGYVQWHEQADAHARSLAKENISSIGVANTMETVRWLYNQHFAAVASDNPAFEATPIPQECCLHEWLLCHWGTSIGELWNLEQLSQMCDKLGKWSFFLTSAPLNVQGGVASPPCAIAVF